MKETFGERFLKFRKNKGFTQEDIAKKLVISRSCSDRWNVCIYKENKKI